MPSVVRFECRLVTTVVVAMQLAGTVLLEYLQYSVVHTSTSTLSRGIASTPRVHARWATTGEERTPPDERAASPYACSTECTMYDTLQ